MATIFFTANIQRHVACPTSVAEGATVERVFSENPAARSYILDDQSCLRKHMTIFIDGQAIRDRVHLSDKVDSTSQIHVIQALSGG